MSNEVPYQQSTLVAQLQAERANAEAYGQTDRVAAVDKQLKELGVKADAAKERKASAEKDDGDAARAKAPQGRTAGRKSEA